MIEMELEDPDESIILKRQTFNAQHAFGKPTPKVFASRRRRRRQRSIVGLQQFANECLPSRSFRQKITWDQTIRLRRGLWRDAFVFHAVASEGWSRRRDSNP